MRCKEIFIYSRAFQDIVKTLAENSTKLQAGLPAAHPPYNVRRILWRGSIRILRILQKEFGRNKRALLRNFEAQWPRTCVLLTPPVFTIDRHPPKVGGRNHGMVEELIFRAA